MPRILIAYDGSQAAPAVVGATGRLFAGAEAVVLVAYDPPRDDRAAAERSAADGRTLAQDAGLQAEAAVVEAQRRVWPEILAAAREHRADVVVCGARGHEPVGRARLGSTASSLLHQSDLPVLVVPGDRAGQADGPLLVAYDGSDAARAALAAGAKLFPGREAVVCHVWHWPLTDTLIERALERIGMEDGRGIVEIFRQEAEADARAVAEDGAERAQAAGLTARAELVQEREGTWRGVAAAAQAAGASLVVAGSRGLGGVTSALLGSVSNALVTHAERATLVVPPVD